MAGQAASRMQHALRLLTLLRVCGEPVGGSDPAGMVVVIRSEKRLQALDFVEEPGLPGRRDSQPR